ncbi:hypothetical protein [Tropicibacter sp. S64]|uniref:hypothetical protein n=1 Tax=Tropicibacter sp. S64 TaxID=3415122 RepID=UPI003C7B423F
MAFLDLPRTAQPGTVTAPGLAPIAGLVLLIGLGLPALMAPAPEAAPAWHGNSGTVSLSQAQQ